MDFKRYVFLLMDPLMDPLMEPVEHISAGYLLIPSTVLVYVCRNQVTNATRGVSA